MWALKEPIVAITGFDVRHVLLPAEVAVGQVLFDVPNPMLMRQALKPHRHAERYVVAAQQPVLVVPQSGHDEQ